MSDLLKREMNLHQDVKIRHFIKLRDGKEFFVVDQRHEDQVSIQPGPSMTVVRVRLDTSYMIPTQDLFVISYAESVIGSDLWQDLHRVQPQVKLSAFAAMWEAAEAKYPKIEPFPEEPEPTPEEPTPEPEPEMTEEKLFEALSE